MEQQDSTKRESVVVSMRGVLAGKSTILILYMKILGYIMFCTRRF
jgi:hypothetical protein